MNMIQKLFIKYFILVLLIIILLLNNNVSGIEERKSIATPYNNPTGLTWDGNYLWVADTVKHDFRAN